MTSFARILLPVLLLWTMAPCAFAQPQAGDQTLAFERGGFWLVNPVTADFALRTKGYAQARLALYRLTDPELLTQVITARAARSLGEGELLRRVADKTKPYWRADFILDSDGKIPVLPVPADIAAGPLPSGIYVLTATAGTAESQTRVAQWFIRSPLDMKLENFGEQSRVLLFDSATRQPRAQTMISWLDGQGKVLTQETSDANGSAVMRRPEGAVVVLAGNNDDPGHKEDIAFTEVSSSKALLPAALIYPSVAAYQPDQAFQLLIVTPGLPESEPVTARTGKLDVPLQALAQGVWQSAVKVPSDQASNELPVVVKQNDRILAQLSLPRAIDPRWTLIWQQRPGNGISSEKLTYAFQIMEKRKPVRADNVSISLQAMTGREATSTPLPNIAPIVVPAVSDKQRYVAPIEKLPLAAPAYYRVTAQMQGQSIGESVMLSLYPSSSWLDIMPDFSDNAVAEGGTAGFTIKLRDSKGNMQNVPVNWQLSRESYKFEWYQADDGRWTYRTKTDLAKAIDGRADATADGAKIDAPVGAGRYRLTVTDNAGHKNEMVFTAGWWLAQLPPQVPEKIVLTAKPEMKDGQEQLAVFIDPTFDAKVWLTVFNPTNASAAHTEVHDIAETGGFIYIPRSVLPATRPLQLAAFAIPSKPGSGIVQAVGQLSLTSAATLQLEPAQLFGSRESQPVIKPAIPESRTMIDFVSTETGDLIYRSDFKPENTLTLPALAAGKSVTARLIASQGNDIKIAEQIIGIDSPVAIDAAPAMLQNRPVTFVVRITASQPVKDKLRLVLVPPPALPAAIALVTIEGLSANRPQSVSVTLPATKVGETGQGYGTLRLENRSGEVLAARPVWMSTE